jgi:hypothetical protein
MMFKDRQDAGRQLARALDRYQGRDAVVFPLPRGGVTLGVEIARALSLPLDLIVNPMAPASRKNRARQSEWIDLGTERRENPAGSMATEPSAQLIGV